MKILCAFTRFNYGTEARGTGIEFESFLPAMRNLGHEVRFIDTWSRETYPDYESLNNALLAAAREFHPDIFFTVQRDIEIWMETVEAIKTMGAAAITWTTDDSFKFFKVSKFIGPHYDAITTTYDYRLADYKAAGIDSAYFTQWAANSHWLQTPKAGNECKYKVTFIGTSYGERALTMERLKAAGIAIECFGYGWPNGAIESEQIPVIMRDSLISLNFSAGFRSAGEHDLQIKARTFEVPGAGGFLLTNAAPGMEALYRIGEEIAVFGDAEDLEQKIHYYQHHLEERNRVANAGYARTRDCHTYEHRLNQIFRFTLERARIRNAMQGKAIDVFLPQRPLSGLERGLRSVLLRLCQLIWPGERGIKAARRITFELSIRLVGERTFTAAGLPGRLFPFD